MVETYYLVIFIISLLLALAYMFIWHRHFDTHITIIFVMVPIVNLSYYLLSRAQSAEAALAIDKFTFVGGCYLLPFITLAIFSLCEIKLNKFFRSLIILINTVIFSSALTIGKTELFYKSVTIERINDVVVFHKVYGPMHKAFTIMNIVYFTLDLIAIGYTYFWKKQVSRKTILLLFLPVLVSMFSFYGTRILHWNIEYISLAYVFALANYLIIAHNICLYNVDDIAIDSLVETGDTGFISFDFKFRYLGSNETARKIFPELNELVVDRSVEKNEFVNNTMLNWVKGIIGKDDYKTHFERDGKSYLIDVNYLFDGMHTRGYQLLITDDTKNQQYIKLLNNFNNELQEKVEEKTLHITQMHDNLIMSMATMVESRDNSTGGHIKRTSQGVKILVDEINNQGTFSLSPEFCHKLIKAAPMHDLGKIAVDDDILRKPGRFTPEEYEEMKKHAAEGARIVHEILKETDDEEFKVIAENVAHYHHERYDGSGYPDGLKGNKIPLEARIMAIADVYDALVSKRVYKESISFEKADQIIQEGMGTQFDKKLKKVYLAARPKLEEYYSSMDQ
ncbi:MAG: HD domain-containing protein [Erysipelotrichaceae bacterium]|nr:HD domain-containing protein [Erysipelotrichaceae bacterium]